MTGGIGVVLHRRKYAVLLVLLCVVLAIQTVSARGVDRFLSGAVASALAFAIWFVVFERRYERAVMAATLIATLAISWARYLSPTNPKHVLLLATDAAMSLFLWSAVFAILRDLFRTRAAGAENVLGSICGWYRTSICSCAMRLSSSWSLTGVACAGTCLSEARRPLSNTLSHLNMPAE